MVVCTANICRSPMAEGLLRAGAGAVGVDAQIASGGSLVGGQPPEPHGVAVMAQRGIDISAHRSHQVQPTDISAADLILAMAREHVVNVVGQVADAFAKTFTIKEFVARAGPAGPKPVATPFSEWLAEVGQGRQHAELLRRAPEGDVDDPLGMTKRVWERTASELEQLSWATLDLIAGYPPRGL